MAQKVIKTWSVESDSAFGIFYTVTQYENGAFACSCPHFIYRHPADGCKHIKRIRAAEEAPKPAKEQYGIFTKVGDQKIRAQVCNTPEEADLTAQALTEGALSNPRNPSPAYWVEKLLP
jgi:hypothetical protein